METAFPYMHHNGSVFRCDGAPSFQSLKRKVEENMTALAKYKVTFELGHSYHANKNPNAEYAIKEGHLAINKADNPNTLTTSIVAGIARRINFTIRKSGFSSWELLCRRSSVDGAVIETTDVEISKKKLADKLHRHNPPLPTTDVSPGDLVMINSSKTKLKPRETFLVNDIEEKNGCQWAETYKMANKMVNRPQLVKTEDLLVLPKQRRKAAIEAEKAIQNILCLVDNPKITPTHAWSYEDYIASSDCEDDIMFDDEMDCAQMDGKIVENDELQEEIGGEAHFSPRLQRQQSPKNVPSLPSNFQHKADPYHERHPTEATEVQLNAVQNLSTVFDDLYHGTQPSVRTSNRLANKPRKDFSHFR